jgi:hypothetical protein
MRASLLTQASRGIVPVELADIATHTHLNLLANLERPTH